jgi:S1-C subfamily serine protease
VTGFLQITSEVALGSPDEVVLEIEPPDGGRRELRLVPTYSEEAGVYMIGVTPPLDANATIAVQPGSPAAIAGLESGDHVRDVSSSHVVFPMPSPTELRARGKDAASAHAISERLYLAAREGRPFQVRVERDGTERDVVLQAQPAPEAERPILGVAPVENHVIDLRSSPLVDRTGLEKDDRLLDVNGVPILRSLDLYHALAQASEKPRMRVVRDGTVVELAQPSLNGEDAAALADDIALAMDQAGTRVRVYPGSAAEEAGLEDGDRILRIDGSPMNRYKDIQIAAQGADRDHPLTLSIERRTDSGSPVFREITVSPRAWHQMWTGLGEPSRVHLQGRRSARRVARRRPRVVEVHGGLVADAEAHPVRTRQQRQRRRDHHDRRRVAQHGFGGASQALLLPVHAQHEPRVSQRPTDPDARRRTLVLPLDREAEGLAGFRARARVQPDGRYRADPVVDGLRDVQRRAAVDLQLR